MSNIVSRQIALHAILTSLIINPNPKAFFDAGKEIEAEMNKYKNALPEAFSDEKEAEAIYQLNSVASDAISSIAAVILNDQDRYEFIGLAFRSSNDVNAKLQTVLELSQVDLPKGVTMEGITGFKNFGEFLTSIGGKIVNGSDPIDPNNYTIN